jgi:hypothetical protein
VRKGAIVTVFALIDLIWEAVAKLGFVLICVIETLNSVVGSFASIMLWTFFCLSKFA